jgi:hypothetical protein
MRWLLLLVVACGGSSAVPDAPFGDAFTGSLPDAQLCATICAGQCVDLQTDPMHCGFCTRACASHLPACVRGTCALADQTLTALHFGGAEVASVTTDLADNLYVTGSFTGTVDFGGGPLTSAGATDIFVASYTGEGAHRWSQAFGGTGDDGGAGIALGNAVLIAGHFTGTVSFGGATLVSTGGTDILELEVDANTGEALVARRWGTSNDDAAYAIAYVQNLLAITGAFGAGNLDFGAGTIAGSAVATGFVAAFDAGGDNLWARRVDGTAPPFTSAGRAVAVDQMSNVVVAGEFSGTGNFPVGVDAVGTDGFVTSYTSGVLSWARTFSGPDDDIANAVAVDATGNIVVGGSYQGSVDFGAGTIPSIGAPDGFLAGYSASGAFQFARHLGAITSSSVNGVAITATGEILATGTLEGAADFGTGPLAPLGKTDVFIAGFGGVAPTFARRYGGADLDSGTAIAAGPGVYVTASGRFRGAVDFGTGSIAGDPSDTAYLVVIAP